MSASQKLRYTIAVLCRRMQLATAIFLAVMAGAVAVALLTPSQYGARMKLLVRNDQSAPGTAEPTSLTEIQVNSEVELLTSADTLRALVREAGLDSEEMSWDSNPKRRAAILAEKALSRLQRALKVAPVEKTNVILAEYTAKDPRAAAAVLRKLFEIYVETHLRAHRPQGAYGFYQAQKAAYEKQLAEEEQRLTELRRRKDAPMLAERKQATLEAYAQVMSQLYDTEAEISQNERKAAELRQQRQRLANGAQSAELAPQRKYIEEELAKTEMELAGLWGRRETIAGRAQEHKGRLSELAEATVKHETLLRKVQEAGENYLLYSKKEEEARLGDALDRERIVNVALAESPVEPVTPSRSRQLIYLGAGFLLAVMCAVGGAFAVERLSETVHTPAQLEALTGLPVLATVPAERT